MAQKMTTYGSTLGVASDFDGVVFEVDSSEEKRRGMVRVFAVMAATALCFFSGRVFEGATAGFTHQEVMDISAKCGEGEFIGGCVGCKECAPYEFSNGGCSIFKDTFCSYCEPIPNCNRENVICQSREDQICLECNCKDPVANWTDIELGKFLDYEMYDRPEFAEISQVGATYSCYYDEQCVPCTVCPLGYFETEACVPKLSADGPFMQGIVTTGITWKPKIYPTGGIGDTQCQKCLDCQVDEWVETQCMYFSDTICKPCTHFIGALNEDPPESWTSTRCYRFESTGPLYPGANAIATVCQSTNGKTNYHKTSRMAVGTADPAKGHDSTWESVEHNPTDEFYTMPCVEFANSVVQTCALCENTRTCDSMGGEYITSHCVEGTKDQVGKDVLCHKCTNSDEMPGYYESMQCDPKGMQDAKWTLCTKCILGEYEHTGCRLSTDTICPPCYPINHCATSETMCSNGRYEYSVTGRTGENNRIANDSECVGPADVSTEAPGFSCDKDYFGAQCSYWKTYADCGVGAGYRERTVKTGKFRGRTDGEFIAWCMMLCDEFPDCTAFEVGDNGDSWTKSGDAKLIKPNSLCSLKNVASGSIEQAHEDYITSLDCYSNTFMMQEQLWRDTMSAIPACDSANCVPAATNIWPAVGCFEGVCMRAGAVGNGGQAPKFPLAGDTESFNDDWCSSSFDQARYDYGEINKTDGMKVFPRMFKREEMIENGTADADCDGGTAPDGLDDLNLGGEQQGLNPTHHVDTPVEEAR